MCRSVITYLNNVGVEKEHCTVLEYCMILLIAPSLSTFNTLWKNYIFFPWPLVLTQKMCLFLILVGSDAWAHLRYKFLSVNKLKTSFPLGYCLCVFPFVFLIIFQFHLNYCPFLIIAIHCVCEMNFNKQRAVEVKNQHFRQLGTSLSKNIIMSWRFIFQISQVLIVWSSAPCVL